MEYPDGEWKFCSCGDSYFLYEDGIGRCSSCAQERMQRNYKEQKRQEAKDNKIIRLEKENQALKKKLGK